jgi:hypothetical protein
LPPLARLNLAAPLAGAVLRLPVRQQIIYFATSAMPGRASAADVYASLNRCLKPNFEGVVGDLDRKALGAVAAIRRHYKTHGEARPDIMTDICARAGRHLRESLRKANALVNHVPGGTDHAIPGSRLQPLQA